MTYSCIRCAKQADRPMCQDCKQKLADASRARRKKEMERAYSACGIPFIEPDDWDYTRGRSALVTTPGQALWAATSTLRYVATSVRPNVNEWWTDQQGTPVVIWLTTQAFADALRGLDIENPAPYQLVLTDFGHEHVTEWWCARLNDVLVQRLKDHRPVIIQTDRKPSDLRPLYGPWANGIIETIRRYDRP